MPDETNDKDRNFAKLREKNEALEAELAKWRSRALDGVVHQAGFDPSDPIASLVREKWESNVEDPDDAAPDAFAEFASEFNLQPSTGQVKDDDDDEDGDDLASRIEAAQQRQRQARGDEPEPTGGLDDISKAEEKGDFNAAFMAKLDQLPTAQV